MGTQTSTWIAIAFCVSQSAIFSGLNLAFFSLSRLRLEVEASSGNESAQKVLALRSDPNLLLTTVLVGNVAINVLLTLLSDSVLAGVSAFLFSTIIITAFGEILPQAYFSRNAMRVTSLLSPVFLFYRTVLYPVTKPVAWLLDCWLGEEGFLYFREKQLRHLIRKHIEASEADIDRIEGLGALNFLAIDDLPVVQEGEPVNEKSIVQVSFLEDEPVFPQYDLNRDDAFLRAIQASAKKWVVLVDEAARPRLVINADAFLRDAFFADERIDPKPYCHRPIVVSDANTKLGSVLSRWNVEAEYPGDNVVDDDLILLWANTRRVITGADILGRLLMGITHTHFRQPA
jgi:metal transporter CNNM